MEKALVITFFIIIMSCKIHYDWFDQPETPIFLFIFFVLTVLIYLDFNKKD